MGYCINMSNRQTTQQETDANSIILETVSNVENTDAIVEMNAINQHIDTTYTELSNNIDAAIQDFKKKTSVIETEHRQHVQQMLDTVDSEPNRDKNMQKLNRLETACTRAHNTISKLEEVSKYAKRNAREAVELKQEASV